MSTVALGTSYLIFGMSWFTAAGGGEDETGLVSHITQEVLKYFDYLLLIRCLFIIYCSIWHFGLVFHDYLYSPPVCKANLA